MKQPKPASSLRSEAASVDSNGADEIAKELKDIGLNANTLEGILKRVANAGIISGQQGDPQDLSLVEYEIKRSLAQLESIIRDIEGSARDTGRREAIQCHGVIEQEWQAYRGSNSFMDIALQTIREAEL